MDGEREWVDFPFLADAAGGQLMGAVARAIEHEIGAQLLPSRTPPDVVRFHNAKDTAHGSVVIRAGKDRGQVSFVLGSWLHCKLASTAAGGGALDIATIIAMLGPETDAPHFMLELIRNGSSSLVLLLDLLPRKDMVSDPAYLARFYGDAELEKLREALERLPQSKVYVPSSLYVRSLVSPTALLYKLKPLDHDSSNPGRSADELDLLVNDILYPISMQVFFTWLHAFRHRARRVRGDESRMLLDRDSVIKEMGIEIDLRSNMPRLFGHEITHRVIQAYRNGV